MRRASGLLLALLSACASEPAPAAPAGDERLAFEGVEKGHEAELRELIDRDLTSYAADGRETHLEDAAFRLRYHFRLEGYADVQVAFERAPPRVLFRVTPGVRLELGRVHFEGNRAFTDEQLKQARPRGFLGASVPFSPRLVTVLKEEVRAAYGEKGYIEAEVRHEEQRRPEEPGRVHVSLVITEGRRYTVAGFEGLPDDPDLRGKLGKRAGEAYTPARGEEVEAAIIDHFRDHGHPFGQAIVTPRIDRATAAVMLAVDARAGAAAKVGGLRIAGNDRTRDAFVRQRADLEPGAEYRATDLRRAEERLQSTHLFRSVRVAPGAFREETGELAIDVSVEEREAGEFSVRGGYGSHEGLRAGLDVAYMNLLGGAELVRAGGTVSTLGYRGDAEVALPYFLGTDFRPGMTGWYEDREFPSFDSRTYGAVASLTYPVTERISVTGGFRHAIIRTDDVEPGVPPGDLLDFAYTAVFIAAAFDFLDNPRLPREGLAASVQTEWSPESFRSDVVFVGASGRVSAYVPLPLELVLATSFQGGIILPRGQTDEIPISLRRFAGGTTTVRGFAQDEIGPKVGGDPTGGEVYYALQTEVRFPIWSDFHGALFGDQGGVWFDHNRVAVDESRWSVGLGLRYYTAAGAFVADVGWNPRREEGERAVEFHFSIGFPF